MLLVRLRHALLLCFAARVTSEEPSVSLFPSQHSQYTRRATEIVPAEVQEAMLRQALADACYLSSG